MKRLLYLFFNKYRFVRKFLGGRWVKGDLGWLWYDNKESLMRSHCTWEDVKQYKPTEEYL